MTAFDIAAGLVVAVSALIGLSRGAVRECVAFFAFALAVAAAVYLLPWSGPVARRLVHPGWAAKGAAVVVVFFTAYVAVRLAGGSVSAALRNQAALGALDRTAGLGFGLVRGLAALGAFYLVFNAVTPAELAPQWITGGRLYPLSRLSGRALAAVAPQGLRSAGGVEQALASHLTSDRTASSGFDAAQPANPSDAGPYGLSDDRRARHRHTLIVRSNLGEVR